MMSWYTWMENNGNIFSLHMSCGRYIQILSMLSVVNAKFSPTSDIFWTANLHLLMTWNTLGEQTCRFPGRRLTKLYNGQKWNRNNHPSYCFPKHLDGACACVEMIAATWALMRTAETLPSRVHWFVVAGNGSLLSQTGSSVWHKHLIISSSLCMSIARVSCHKSSTLPFVDFKLRWGFP